MKKYKPIYSEEMKSKRHVYMCYSCNLRTVRYHGGVRQCTKCKAVFESVTEIKNDKPK